MLSTLLLVALFACNPLAVAIPTGDTATSVVIGASMINPSTSIPGPKELSAIFSSISSLFGLLKPPSNVAAQLSAFPKSILSELEGLNALSAVDQLYADSSTWFIGQPTGVESWLLNLPTQAVSILPQVISLQSLANNAIYPSTITPAVLQPTMDVSATTAFPVVTATATLTAHRDLKRRLTEGQQIGIIVGGAAFIAVSITLGTMIYDVWKKRMIAKQMAAAHAEHRRIHPLVSGVPRRQSKQSGYSRPSRGSRGSMAELGGGHGDDITAAPPGSYEMHSPVVGSSRLD